MLYLYPNTKNPPPGPTTLKKPHFESNDNQAKCQYSSFHSFARSKRKTHHVSFIEKKVKSSSSPLPFQEILEIQDPKSKGFP
jgi:hypothetical protein